MDVNRAKAIVDSTEQFEVHHDGKSVWIESVDSTSKTATVHEQEGSPAQTYTVRVDQLQEIGVQETI